MTDSSSSSLPALISFLDQARNKGDLKPPTAAAVKSSVSRVLSVLDDNQRADVSRIDLDAALRRFANLNPGVTSQSLRDYKARIEKALEMFLSWRADPVNWSPRNGRSASQSTDATSKRAVGTRRRSRATVLTTQAPTAISPQSSSVSLAYPFPLRADLTVMISNVPRDLKIVEAERLAVFLRSLAEDYKPS